MYNGENQFPKYDIPFFYLFAASKVSKMFAKFAEMSYFSHQCDFNFKIIFFNKQLGVYSRYREYSVNSQPVVYSNIYSTTF